MCRGHSSAFRLFLLQSSNVSLCPLSSLHSTSSVLNICYKVTNSQVPKYTLVSCHFYKMRPWRLKVTPTYHPTFWEIRNSARVFRSTEQTTEHPLPPSGHVEFCHLKVRTSSYSLFLDNFPQCLVYVRCTLMSTP